MNKLRNELGLKPEQVDKSKYDGYFTAATGAYIDSLPLAKEFEGRMIEKLLPKVIDADNLRDKDTGVINRRFPSGSYLFHSATTASLVKILQSGSLVNSESLAKGTKTNGGSEGISWSLGGIEAMPATRYHIAGFVAAPESAVGSGYELAIPDRAAPYEVVQVPQSLNPMSFYDSYARARALERDYKTLKAEGADNEQTKDMLQTIMAAKAQLGLQVASSPAVAVPVEKMYFVAPASDLETWLRVIARCGSKPAGIIAYDNDDIFMEDFVQAERGHGSRLHNKISQVIPNIPGKTMQYADVLGVEFDDSLRDPIDLHTMNDIYRADSKTIRNENGQLKLHNNPGP